MDTAQRTSGPRVRASVRVGWGKGGGYRRCNRPPDPFTRSRDEDDDSSDLSSLDEEASSDRMEMDLVEETPTGRRGREVGGSSLPPELRKCRAMLLRLLEAQEVRREAWGRGGDTKGELLLGHRPRGQSACMHVTR